MSLVISIVVYSRSVTDNIRLLVSVVVLSPVLFVIAEEVIMEPYS